MAGKRKIKDGAWQYTFKRAGVLDKPIYMTFHDEAEGDAYAARLDALLDRGVVPNEFKASPKIVNVQQLVREYEREAHPSPKDSGALGTILATKGKVMLSSINAAWVDEWIAEMKRVDKLAPATIRAKVGALARCTDWGMRKGYLQMPDHPLRSLPDGYAQYSKADAAAAGTARRDVERDRRLEAGEYERILAVIAEGELPRKQRPMLFDALAIRCLFILAVESAMRLREMYTLSFTQVDLTQRTIFLDRTKNGDKRQVPLSSVAMKEIQDYLCAKDIVGGLIFPWWDGAKESLHDVSDHLSKTYRKIFEHAGCHGLSFHDLRHEATSRLFERTRLTETEIMKITGHKSHRMLMRYSNLRGSTLAAALW